MSADRLNRASSFPDRVATKQPGNRPRPAPWRGATISFVCLLVLLLLPRTTFAQGIRWRTDYATALKEASEKDLPLFVNVGTENCFWCKQLDARTFVVEDVARMLNERFIPLKIDGAANTYLVQALRVQSYPTLIYAGPDGSILGYKEGFVEATPLKEQLGKVLTSVGTPDWMKRDFDAAGKAIAANDSAKALTLLKGVVEDGKNRPLQVRGRKLIADLEKQAGERAALAQQLADKGKTTEAIAALTQLNKSYPGTLAARRGSQMLVELTSKSEAGKEERRRQASDLLKQAREDYKNRQYLCALDRCEGIATRFADLPEAAAAEKLAAEIKENPEWTKAASDQLSDRLCVLYLALGDAWLKKGQPQQAIYYLERITKMFPGTRHSELAQQKLTRLRGAPTVGERKSSADR